MYSLLLLFLKFSGLKMLHMLVGIREKGKRKGGW